MSGEEMDHGVTIRELVLPGCRYVRRRDGPLCNNKGTSIAWIQVCQMKRWTTV